MAMKGRSGVVLTTILLLGYTMKVTASPAANLFDPNNPENFEVRNEILKQHSVDSRNIGSTLRQDADLSICERRSKSSVFAFGRCPESCGPVTTEVFRTCAGLVLFGCDLIPCGAGLFTCTLREDLSRELTVCPGDRVVFDSVKLDRLKSVKLSIDLKASPLKTDFYLLSDATGSMVDAIASVQTRFQEIIDTFSSRSDVAFGVGFYRDETELDQGFRNLLPLTTDVAAAKEAVKKLEAIGGGDFDEANLVALYKVSTDPSIGWRERSRKILVYFGDYPGHEPSCVSGLPTLTRDVVVDALNARKITVVAASFSPGLDQAPSPFGCGGSGAGAGTGQASSITLGTAGRLVTGNQKEVIEVITRALRNLSRTFDVDESECVADIESVHNPELPVTIPAGESTTVTNTLGVRDSVCSAKGAFECNYSYTEGGADLERTTIELVNIIGCPSF